jgi:hypothetical protein
MKASPNPNPYPYPYPYPNLEPNSHHSQAFSYSSQYFADFFHLRRVFEGTEDRTTSGIRPSICQFTRHKTRQGMRQDMGTRKEDKIRQDKAWHDDESMVQFSTKYVLWWFVVFLVVHVCLSLSLSLSVCLRFPRYLSGERGNVHWYRICIYYILTFVFFVFLSFAFCLFCLCLLFFVFVFCLISYLSNDRVPCHAEPCLVSP